MNCLISFNQFAHIIFHSFNHERFFNFQLELLRSSSKFVLFVRKRVRERHLLVIVVFYLCCACFISFSHRFESLDKFSCLMWAEQI